VGLNAEGSGEGRWDLLRVLAIVTVVIDVATVVVCVGQLAQDGVFGTLAQVALQVLRGLV
jgi:hypothetical protein